MKMPSQFFEEISRIPRCSGQEQGICDHLERFAIQHHLSYRRDAMHNIVICKPASHGMEKVPTVLLQGHTDMVGEKAEGSTHDFAKDPIHIIKEGDLWRADGTTLGGDNGTAVATMMAILADPSAKHPPLECVFTSQEETGLFGAMAFDTTDLKAACMINLDCGAEGNYLVSCAGGLRANVQRNVSYQKIQGTTYQLDIRGLQGGHSGANIHQERANALVLIARSLHRLQTVCNARLIDLAGGSKDNVIPSHAFCKFASVQDPTAVIASLQEDFIKEFGVSDPMVTLSLTQVPAEQMLTEQDSRALITLMLLCPCGVVQLSAAQPGMVETSSNMGTVKIQDGHFALTLSMRSSGTSRKLALYAQLEELCALVGAQCSSEGDYPGWAYEPVSPLRELVGRVYQERTGKEAVFFGIHAGVECGVFKGKMPHLDIIAMNSLSGDVHTTKEWLSVSSLNDTCVFLQEVLAAMA